MKEEALLIDQTDMEQEKRVDLTTMGFSRWGMGAPRPRLLLGRAGAGEKEDIGSGACLVLSSSSSRLQENRLLTGYSSRPTKKAKRPRPRPLRPSPPRAGPSDPIEMLMTRFVRRKWPLKKVGEEEGPSRQPARADNRLFQLWRARFERRSWVGGGGEGGVVGAYLVAGAGRREEPKTWGVISFAA